MVVGLAMQLLPLGSVSDAVTKLVPAFPKFVIRLRILANELRKAKGTSKHMILVPLSI